jgi:hypothetical protein
VSQRITRSHREFLKLDEGKLVYTPGEKNIKNTKSPKRFVNFTLLEVLNFMKWFVYVVNPLNAKLNPIRHVLALVGAHHFVHVSRIRVN